MDKKLIYLALAAVVVIAAVLVMTMPRGGQPPGPSPGPSPGPGPSPEPGPSPSPGPAGHADDSGATVEGVKAVADGNNEFALDLYSNLKDSPENAGKNVFFSPYSISDALAMTYEGARGQTADEMASVFHFPTDANIRRPAFARIYNILNPANATYELRTANALWAQKDFTFLPDYFATVLNYYVGNVTNLDFMTKTEESRVTINTWVEGQTNNRIKDLIPSGILRPDTRLVLTNAIYFKGLWATQFNKTYTEDADFKVSDSKTVIVKMMNMADKRFKYAEDDKMQALELPYKGGNLSMLILLPKGDISSLEAELSAQKVSEIASSVHEQKLPIYIPKFKFETKSMLADTLAAMGMPTAFSDIADFSGMDGKKDLKISEVIHQAFVEVNEEGTEAAAATAVIIMPTSAGPTPSVEFRADHPFIFLIREKSTGSILFMGRVMDPTAG